MTEIALAVASLAVVAACGDSVSDPRNASENPVAQASFSDPSVQGMRSRLHESNRFDWVGQAHNRMLDDFRRELRKPGIRNDACRFIMEFSMRPERLPHGHALAGTAAEKAGNAGAASTRLCGRGSRGLHVGNASWRPRSEVESQTVDEFATRIELAIDQAADSYDLAARLTPILGEVSSLPNADDQTVLSAAIAVAQSSFEYWESYYPAFEQDIATEYGPCAADASSQGYSLDEVTYLCLNGQWTQSRRTFPGAFTSPFRVASFTPVPSCVGLEDGFKSIGKADLKGALAGALASLYTTAGATAPEAAVVGAGVGSTIAALENAWSCLMR